MAEIYEARFMRVLVLFDLPTQTKQERREATQFRNMLLREAFVMLQYSVYVKICRGQDVVDGTIFTIKRSLPSQGNVRVLQITDKQYGRMEILVGEQITEEQEVGVQQLLLF